MNYAELKENIVSELKIKCWSDHPLKKYSSFNLGGLAKLFVEPESISEFAAVIEVCRVGKVPHIVLGNGSNVIFSDEPYEGVVISTKKLNKIKINKNIVYAQSGVNLDTLVAEAVKRGLAGLEELSQIPGSVGGAVWMNAGAFHGEVSDYIVSVKVLDGKNKIRTLNRAEIDFGYREVPTFEGMILLEAKFRLFKENPKDLLRRRKEIIKKRSRKHPLKYPSAGSVFKRPEGYFVRRLIEEVGLPGKTIGRAQISKKHPGFIVNLGNAKSKDVINLVRLIRDKIYKRFRIKLELEQVVVGQDLLKMLE